jgi:AcrR family transcriptional regulator
MPRARRLPAEDRRRQIIESAREVFASQSFAKVGTADLAKAVGVSEPALYRYFSGKKELFLATLRSTAPKLLDLWQNIASDVDDPLETLWSIGIDYYDHLQSHSGNMRLQFQAISEAHDPEIRQALRENFASFVDFVAETLDEGKRRGNCYAEHHADQ